MKVKMKTLDNIPLQYETSGACAFDFKAVEDVHFEPGEWKLVDTGCVIETPKGYVLQIAPRSSTFKKHGLMLVNSIGIIDQDYCGDNDTIKFAYINMSGVAQDIEAGTRIGQGMFLQIAKADFEVVDTMKNPDRGGFGSTGIK